MRHPPMPPGQCPADTGGKCPHELIREPGDPVRFVIDGYRMQTATPPPLGYGE